MGTRNAGLSTPALLATVPSVDRVNRLPRISALAVALIAGVHFALFGYFVFRTAVTSPISDMFVYIDVYLRFRAGQLSVLDYLWRAHGEHHLVWTRLLTWADVEIFHTRGIPFMAAATAAISGAAVLIWQQLRRAEPMLGRPTSLGLLAPMLILSSANVTDCSVPINTTYPLTVFFFIVALVLFAGERKPNSNADYRRLAAIPAAVAASLGTAGGLLAWPILLWIAWRERLSRAWLVTLAGVGIVYALLYAQKLYLLGLAPALQSDASAFFAAAHLGKLLDYFFAFLGLPFTRAPQLALIGRAVGAALFVLGLSTVLTATLTRRLSTPLDRIAIGMILFSCGCAALAAVGRGDLTDEVNVPVRYTMFTTALHVGLLCVLLPRFVRRTAVSRDRMLQSAGALLFASVLLIQQVFVGRLAEQTASAIAREADCYAGGTQIGPVSNFITRSPTDAEAVLAALRQRGLLAPRSNQCMVP